ncbi:MAG: response regulator transcription factor [Acidobacteriaceae bacterium]|nr:response regulator transcription factor [Acidobacteriaceae bacterium]
MIRAVLVDDEPPARRKLRHLLSSEKDVSLIGEAGSGAQAVELLNRLQPDLAFIDVQLPDCTGFDIVESLQSRDRMHLIFVTAHEDFALKAFDVHAADYLLKPVEPSRFAQSLARIRRTMATPNADLIASRLGELMEALRSNPAYARRVLIQEDDRSVFLEVGRIDWIEAARNYVCIHSGDRTYIARSSLESIAAKLDPAAFRRINRSEIVNVERIVEVRSWFHGDQKVVLKTGNELNWSRRYRPVSLDELERA